MESRQLVILDLQENAERIFIDISAISYRKVIDCLTIFLSVIADAHNYLFIFQIRLIGCPISYPIYCIFYTAESKLQLKQIDGINPERRFDLVTHVGNRTTRESVG